jgi:hypothetical protein
MEHLNTQTVATNYNSPPAVYQTGGAFKVEIPQSSVTVPKPLSYKFRVAEYEKDGEIVKVGLQVQTWEHDNYGSCILKKDWTDVERVRLPYTD